MKHRLLVVLVALLTVSFSYAQDAPKEDLKEAKDTGERKDYNKWTIEVTAGQSKGTRPFTEGYYSSNPDSFFGTVRVNTFSVGVRYMFSSRFGLKVDLSSDEFSNNKNTKSLDFQLQQYRVGFQGVVNASRLFNIQRELGRLSLLIHAGIQVSRSTPKLAADKYDPNYYYNKSEYNGGVMFGISPEVRISKKFSVIGDFSSLSNFRQHFTWDGRLNDVKNNLSGQMIMASLGLTYSFGNDNIHGDWAIIDESKLKEIEALDKRIGDLESMMNDTDKDGVPDYLDVENNSIAGVAVDTKGRMVDINKNGIPDELESYMSNNFIDKSSVGSVIEGANSDMIKKMIHDGYVATYFETGKTRPTQESTEGIGFILTFLRNNPGSSLDIVGHADEIGSSAYNNKLSNDRAKNVRQVLMDAGIDGSRLSIVSEGEDNSVLKDSADARRLVRRVTFKIKN
ncbi:MAG: OmpA family protein [Flavobacterium sp.]|nr:OmpA family protein [Flavobacterium sp.]